MEAGTATGWQATDWLEDIILRTAGVDAYNKWITHELHVRLARGHGGLGQGSREIFFTEGYVYGGNTAIVATAADPAHGSDVPDRRELGRLHPRLLDAEAGDLVRPRLLPGSAHQRAALAVRDR